MKLIGFRLISPWRVHGLISELLWITLVCVNVYIAEAALGMYINFNLVLKENSKTLKG